MVIHIYERFVVCLGDHPILVRLFWDWGTAKRGLSNSSPAQLRRLESAGESSFAAALLISAAVNISIYPNNWNNEASRQRIETNAQNTYAVAGPKPTSLDMRLSTSHETFQDLHGLHYPPVLH
jgi:hypothetical protein